MDTKKSLVFGIIAIAAAILLFAAGPQRTKYGHVARVAAAVAGAASPLAAGVPIPTAALA